MIDWLVLAAGVLALLAAGAWAWVVRRERERQRALVKRLLSLPGIGEDAVRAAGATVITLPDGATLCVDVIGKVQVTAAGVRYRERPGLDGAILGVWAEGQTVLWMGIAPEDPAWWLVWDVEVAGYQTGQIERVGWTHRDYLRQVGQ